MGKLFKFKASPPLYYKKNQILKHGGCHTADWLIIKKVCKETWLKKLLFKWFGINYFVGYKVKIKN